MIKATARKHTPEFKITLLKKHLVNKAVISELCEEFNIKPSLFYRWQQELFSQGELVFKTNGKSTSQSSLEKKIVYLENKLQKKNEAISELMEEHIKLKKNIGEI